MGRNNMKKKLAALLCAAVLAMSLPAMAFAAQFNSPAGTTVAGSNGVALTVKGDVSGNGFIHVEPSSVQASNVPAGVTPIASFEVTADDSISFTELTFVSALVLSMLVRMQPSTSSMVMSPLRPSRPRLRLMAPLPSLLTSFLSFPLLLMRALQPAPLVSTPAPPLPRLALT